MYVKCTLYNYRAEFHVNFLNLLYNVVFPTHFLRRKSVGNLNFIAVGLKNGDQRSSFSAWAKVNKARGCLATSMAYVKWVSVKV